jgi:hypothetical protein
MKAKPSDSVFFTSDEWDFDKYENDVSNSFYSTKQFEPLDDEGRAGVKFLSLLNSLTQVGAEVSQLRSEVNLLSQENIELKKKVETLFKFVQEKNFLNLDDFQLACDVMSMPESERLPFEVQSGDSKKCEFFH